MKKEKKEGEEEAKKPAGYLRRMATKMRTGEDLPVPPPGPLRRIASKVRKGASSDPDMLGGGFD